MEAIDFLFDYFNVPEFVDEQDETTERWDFLAKCMERYYDSKRTTDNRSIIQTISLLNSMVESGECHSKTSREMVVKSLEILKGDVHLAKRRSSHIIKYIHIDGEEYVVFNDKWICESDTLEDVDGNEYLIVKGIKVEDHISSIHRIIPKCDIMKPLFVKYSI